jgi:hypothetical protein
MNAIKKRAWKSEQLSTKSEHLKDNKDNKVDWRRNKVLELSSQGYSQRDIASTLQVGLGTVNKDILFLRHLSQENLQHHIHERVPEEYQNCMTGMKINLKQTLEIAETTSDPRTKLQARAVANDCYKYIMDLTTNGVVITDAIKFVQTNREKLAMSNKKEDDKECKEPDHDNDNEQLEEEQEKETGGQETTNQVF